MNMRINLNLIGMIFIFVGLQACNTAYVQIYEVKAKTDLQTQDKAIIFENKHLSITYDLWLEGGNPCFSIYNKTNAPIYLDKKRTFFVINDQAKDYYLNRIYTDETTTKATDLYNSISIGNATGVSYREKEMITIPAKTYKSILEFSVSDAYYPECDQEKFPSRRKIKTTTYDASDSPFKFENRITYLLYNNKEIHKVKNAFYVSAITNYPKKEVIENLLSNNCGDTYAVPEKVNTQEAPHRFYVNYTKRF